jgi:hypothetical protein
MRKESCALGAIPNSATQQMGLSLPYVFAIDSNLASGRLD